MKTIKLKSKKTFFLNLGLLVLLFLTFQVNLFRTVSNDSFLAFQTDSQALVMGRLAYSEKVSLLGRSGLLGFSHPIPENIDKNAYQYKISQENLSVSDFEPYNSQPGLHGVFFALLLRLTGLTGFSAFFFLQCLVAFFTAFMFVCWINWLIKEWGKEQLIPNLLFLMLSLWIVLFARNLYWVLGIFYIPFIVSLFVLQRYSRNKFYNNRQIGWLVFISMFVKGLFTGFEYVTTVYLMTLVPFVYYAIRDRWNRIEIKVRFTTAIFSIGCACLSTALVLIVQLIPEKGNFYKAAQYLWYAFGKRSYDIATNFSYGVNESESIRSSLWEVLIEYLKMPICDLSHRIQWEEFSFISKIPVGSVIFLFFMITLFLVANSFFRKKKWSIELKAMTISLWFSLLAPLSWIIIFKGHSYIHTHMNGIIWNMPFLLWGIAWLVALGCDKYKK